MNPRFNVAPTVDRGVFEALRDDLGYNAMQSLVALFAERAPQLDELQRAGRLGNDAELARIAHSVKGGAALLAAPRLAELAAELENRGLSRKHEGTPALAEEAAVEFGRAVAEMRDALGEPIERSGGSSGAQLAGGLNR